MGNRVVLGQVGAAFKLRVSKSGVDALTAAVDQMLLDSDYSAGRFIASGSHLWPANVGGPRLIPYSGLGGAIAWPLVILRRQAGSFQQPYTAHYQFGSDSVSGKSDNYVLTVSGGFLTIAASSNPINPTVHGNIITSPRHIYYAIIAT